MESTKEIKNSDLATSLKGKSGYLPCQYIEMALKEGMISSPLPIESTQIQPVSLDLRLGQKAYRIQCSFLPENDPVETKLKEVTLYEFDISNGGILEKNAIYLIPLMEELNFPSDFYGLANPKSSTGRLDMFTRVIVDEGHRFDEIPSGYRGKLYLEVIPRSFPVKVKAGLSLNQLRVAHRTSKSLDKKKLEIKYKKNPILFHRNGMIIPIDDVKLEEGVYVGVDVAGDLPDSIVAYKAKTNSNVIDLSKIRYYKAEEFWEPIYRPPKDRLILEPESFYIMMSKEKICIWPDWLAEMIAYEPNSGELRTHYAGFFDSGFGWNGTDNVVDQGTRAVMEVRPHDVPFMVEHGQTFCRLKFERVVERPDKVYGIDLKSNYHSQGLALSKYFESP
ncbi:MAG: 2'-deoxycytidine 5'-triphosphate deaminase [Nitrospina sp.]|jgi:dCTP deaminase|nr:2'-deoxycytidine 5'-triphosphate deaminase [Nitrospina sp.]MBT6716475.1 2'-deoxycytidine 5'-triphosphate deaminase [Nitrospina sp.]